MQYGLTLTPSLNNSECLVLGFLDNVELPHVVSILDTKLQALIQRLHKKLLVNKSTLWQSDVDGKSLFLVYCGEKAKYKTTALPKLLTNITENLITQKIMSATICLPQVENCSPNAQIEAMILSINQRSSQFLEFKSKQHAAHALESVQFYLEGATKDSIENGHAIASGIQLTRTLANTPANVCTPTFLAKQALMLAEQYAQVNTQVFDKKDIEEMGMGSFLSVAQGSHEPPTFVEIQYNGNSRPMDPIVLIGKGITFDSGGISLKPAEGMNEMKYDMCGAASVLGTIKACAELKLPIRVIGLIACTENMPGGSATKPGDIVTSMSCQTIEIVNTDAEGRLILADALTYAERFNPKFVIDIATLTGAVIIALGFVASGFMTKDEDLATLIQNAALESNDKVWRLPLDDAYQEALDSPMADMVNATFDRVAGSVTAACFLSRFAEKFRWAHLDIAGTAWVSGKKNDATGRPVPLLIQLLRHVAQSS